jgi:hypothetical protein
MTVIGYTAPPFFAAQKGRKRLFSVPLTVTVSTFTPGSTPAQWVVRVSSLTVGGVFLIQAMPPAWTEESPATGATATVRSPTFSPAANGDVFSFTAFPTYLDNSGLASPTTNYSASYRIDVVDTANSAVVVTTQFSLAGSADPAVHVNVVFALDHGTTMKTSIVTPNRLARLQAAFSRGVKLLRETDDFLGVASFANAGCPSNPHLDLRLATQQQQSDAIGLANGLVQDESTTQKFIQSGIDAGRAVDPTATLVLLTDGTNFNRPALVAPTLPTSALIISENPAAPPPSAANMVSAGTGRYLMATPQTLGEFAIEKLLTQILIGIAGTAFVSDPEGSIEPGEQQTFPLHITEADRELDVIVFSNDGMALHVDPQVGQTHSSSEHDPNADGSQGTKYTDCGEKRRPRPRDVHDKGVVIKRLELPALHRDRPRNPTVTISRIRQTSTSQPAPPVRFNLLVVAKTDLILDAEVTAAGLAVGSDLLFSAVLHEYGLTWEREGVCVYVELSHPDGFVQTVHLEECKGAPGRFQASLRSFQVGAYSAHFVATGRSLLCQDIFRREVLRTVAVFPANQCCPADDPCASRN